MSSVQIKRCRVRVRILPALPAGRGRVDITPNRSRQRAWCCLFVLLGAAMAWPASAAETVEAAEVTAPVAVEPETIADRMQRLRRQAETLRREAQARHAAAQRECWSTFLVSACQDKAAKALRGDTERAQALEREARQLDRDERKRQFAEREARRLEEAPAREAAAAARAERNRLDQEEAERRIEGKAADAASR